MSSRFVNREATDEITLANGDKVQVRQRLTAEEQAVLNRQLISVKADVKSGDIDVEDIAWHLQRIQICEAYLVSWDFKDDSGKAMPFEPGLIRMLDEQTTNEIANAVDAIQKARREQQEKKVGRR